MWPRAPAGLLPGLTKGCSPDAVGTAARALGGGVGTPERRCGPMPSARVGGGRTSAGEHKGMSPAGAPGPRADGAEELRKRSLCSGRT